MTPWASAKLLSNNPMGKHSISFIFLVLVLGLFIGTVAGSLLARVFGLEILNHSLFGGLVIARDFYLVKNLELQFTPAGLLGLVLTAWLLYKTKEKD